LGAERRFAAFASYSFELLVTQLDSELPSYRILQQLTVHPANRSRPRSVQLAQRKDSGHHQRNKDALLLSSSQGARDGVTVTL